MHRRQIHRTKCTKCICSVYLNLSILYLKYTVRVHTSTIRVYYALYKLLVLVYYYTLTLLNNLLFTIYCLILFKNTVYSIWSEWDSIMIDYSIRSEWDSVAQSVHLVHLVRCICLRCICYGQVARKPDLNSVNYFTNAYVLTSDFFCIFT